MYLGRIVAKRAISISTRRLSAYNPDPVLRKSLADINAKYHNGKSISVVTAHDYITSKYAEAAGIDITLVGDSLAMTCLGYEDTNEISLQEFLWHTKSVSRGNKSSFLVADMPFGTFEKNEQQATETATTLVKEGKVHAVKLEYNKDIIPSIRKIVNMGIPVMGHVGLTPQHHNTMGGYRLQGNSVARALQIYQECLELQENGAFALVLECIPNKLAQYITENVKIPTIGIGAGPYCSGQVLVAADVLGMNHPGVHRAKFVKQYQSQFKDSVDAYKNYISDIESRNFPLEDEHGYKIKKQVLEQFKIEAENLK